MYLRRGLICIGIALPGALVGLPRDAQAQSVVIDAQFEGAANFHRGIAPVSIDKQWGFIDRSGVWVVRPRYTDVRPGSEGLFAVESDGRWGYVDAKAQSKIEPRFEAAEAFQGGTAAVKSNGHWGYVRADGKMETEFMFLEIGGREGAYISARDDKGWAVFKGLPNAAPKRGDIGDGSAVRAYSISESSVIVKFDDEEKMFLIETGENSQEPDYFYLSEKFSSFSHPTKYINLRRMSEGFAPASVKAGQWGYLHKRSGEFLWPHRFQDAFEFSGGFAPVKIDGKWGYIDQAGRIAVRPTYDAAYPFRGEYAVIREGNKRGFLRLDPQGGISVFIAPKFDDASRFTESLAPVKIGERWGYISNGQPWSELRESDIVDIRPK